MLSTKVEQNAKLYDQIPYASFGMPQTHPSHLAAVATIFGLSAPAPDKARILELGCASGGNIIPLALHYPEVEVVGIDASGQQIEQGRRAVKSLGLEDRVQLIHRSISELDDSLGTFDYVICHGVYSWVPDEIREAILQQSRERLNKNGIAYISYNTYPGWKFKEVARDAINFHTRNMEVGTQKIQQSVAMINFLIDKSSNDSLVKSALDKFRREIDGRSRSYFVHEYLEIDNQPCYFTDFIKRAREHQLEYLSDTGIATGFGMNYGQENFDQLVQASGYDQVVLEQYLDFLNNRQFRSSLLIRSDNPGTIQRRLDGSIYRKLAFLAGQITKSGKSGDSQEYKLGTGRTIKVSQPTEIAALDALALRTVRPITYQALSTQLKSALDSRCNEKALLNLLDILVCSGDLSVWDHDSAAKQPELSELPEAPVLPVPHQEYYRVFGHLSSAYNFNSIGSSNPLMDIVIPLLDGKTSRQGLLAALSKAAEANELKVFDQNKEPAAPEARQSVLTQHLNHFLNRLHQMGMFIPPQVSSAPKKQKDQPSGTSEDAQSAAGSAEQAAPPKRRGRPPKKAAAKKSAAKKAAAKKSSRASKSQSKSEN